MSEQKHYGHYDDSIMDDDWYAIHVNAMTAEKLHSKAEIAAELAYRDRRIKALEAKWTVVFDGSAIWEELERKVAPENISDVLDAVARIAKRKAAGYGEVGR